MLFRSVSQSRYATRDLRYFKYYKDYNFIAFTFNGSSDFTVNGVYAGNPLIVGGTADFYQPITFSVQTNNIIANEVMTNSQFVYLLSMAKGTIYANGISLSLANSVLTASIDDGKGGSSSSHVTLPCLPLAGGMMNDYASLSFTDSGDYETSINQEGLEISISDYHEYLKYGQITFYNSTTLEGTIMFPIGKTGTVSLLEASNAFTGLS